MGNKERTEEEGKPYIPLLSVEFEDKSRFDLPQEWEDVFVDYYGHDPKFYPEVAGRLKFVTGEYVEHRAWPSKFDGLQYEIEEDEIVKEVGDEKYDDPEFYWQPWDKEEIIWGSGDQGRKVEIPPSFAEIAEAVMYFSMRSGLLQKYLQQLGSKTRVVNTEQFLKELKDNT